MGSSEVTDTDIPGDEVPRHIRLHADEFPGKIALLRKLMRLQAELDETKSRCGDLRRRKTFLELNVDDLERMVAKLQCELYTSQSRLSEALEEARAMAHALNLEMQARQRTEVMMEDVKRNKRARSPGQCRCQESLRVSDRKVVAPSVYISQVSLTLTDLSDACVQTDNYQRRQTSTLTQTDFKNENSRKEQFDACVQVSNDAETVDACVQTAVFVASTLDHPTRPSDVTTLRYHTNSWSQTDFWDSLGQRGTGDANCACTQTFYGCSDTSTQTDCQSRESASTVHAYVTTVVANAVAEHRPFDNLDAPDQQSTNGAGRESLQCADTGQDQNRIQAKQIYPQEEEHKTYVAAHVNQQDQFQKETYCKQKYQELSPGQDIFLQDKEEDKTPCCSDKEIETVFSTHEKTIETSEDKVLKVNENNLVYDDTDNSTARNETKGNGIEPNVSAETLSTRIGSDVSVTLTDNNAKVSSNCSTGENVVATSENGVDQVTTRDTENVQLRQEKDSELGQKSSSAKDTGKMSYLYDPVLDIYYKSSGDDQHGEDVALPDDDIKNDHADSDDCSPVSTTLPSTNVDTCGLGPSILGCSTGSQGFRPPDSSSLVSKLPESNSSRLGFSPPDSKTNNLDSSGPVDDTLSSLGCRTSLQDRLGLMSKMRMTNSFSIQEEEEEEDGCEEDLELFPGVGRGPLPVLREESMEMSSDAEENHFIPVVHEPSSEKSPASSEDEEPLDLPRRGSLLQPRDDAQASRSKSEEFIGEMRRGSSGFLTRPKVHRRSDPIKKASLQELRKISFCRGGRPILSFSEEGVVDLLYGSLDEVELTEEDRKRNLELLEECRIASERFKNRPRPYKFKKAGKTERERPESPTRQETAEESGHLADKESSLETPPEEEEEEKEEQKLKKRSSTRSLRVSDSLESSNSTDSDIDVKADILRGLNSTFPQTKPAGGGYQDFPIKPSGKGGGYKDFPLPKAQGGYRDFPLVKISGGSGGYQDFPLRPIPGPPGETPTPPQKALREQGRGAEENKVRFGNTAAVSSRLPELAEASETESKQDEDSDRSSPSSSPEDHTEVVSRSMPESVLRNLGLATSQPQRCLTEEEVENRFTALALEWRTDSYTLEKRCLLLERQRDVAEKNLDQEMGMLRGSLVGLNHLVKDRETHELMRELHQQMDIIHHLNIKVSIKSEMHGSVQQEWRVSRAIEVMMQHVENLKRLYEREHSELEEMRRRFCNTRADQSKKSVCGHFSRHEQGAYPLVLLTIEYVMKLIA
ncbi:MRVI1 [Branchiostoma lanceolatum]|uniref:MRVI1 protein n=1 Tax=Branchiostoma lanceolatum TaxID=7740 RepID=A0A8K0A2R2_BRALA|nr:MRVI1 [Branchiostoma lanceolatum]